MHSHFSNVEEPGSYEKILNLTIKVNNLPEIKIPNISNSRRILNLPTRTATLSAPREEETVIEQSQVQNSQAANVTSRTAERTVPGTADTNIRVSRMATGNTQPEETKGGN